MAKQAVELMFGAYRRELLAQLLLRPDEDFHLRELERMTAIQHDLALMKMVRGYENDMQTIEDLHSTRCFGMESVDKAEEITRDWNTGL